MIARAIHAAARALGRRRVRAFRRALRDPARAQAERLASFLAANARTAYGRGHGYAAIASVRAFQERIPVASAEALAPWIARVAAGERQVLSASPVRAFERTSGTAAGQKLVPFTAPFLAELGAALAVWIDDLFRARPALGGLRQYWSLSPAARPPEHTAGGAPIGLGDDTAYLDPLSRAAMRRVMAVPGSLARAPDLDTWRRRTLAHLLAADDLGLISVWSPSFLTLLMQALECDLDAYLALVPAHRAGRIRRGLDAAGRLTGEAIWPRLQLVSCWADGPAAAQLASLTAYFPRTTIQPKGLLATEGVISFPLWHRNEAGAVAAATSHFLEFIDLDHPDARPRLVHELRAGGVYSPLLTTGAGLARYHLQDVVRCTGHEGALPLLRFEGKLDRVSDVAGEKLVAAHVEPLLRALAAEAGVRFEFALLAPVLEPAARYLLFIETQASDAALARLAGRFDAELARTHHYGYCRALGQLAPLGVQRVSGGWETYQRVLTEGGTKLGDIKPAHLDGRVGWEVAFREAPGPAEEPVRHD